MKNFWNQTGAKAVKAVLSNIDLGCRGGGIMCKLLCVPLVVLSFSNIFVCDLRQEGGKPEKQSPTVVNEQPSLEPRIPPRLFSLLLKARAVSAELRSDSLIRLATSKLAEAKDLKVELLVEAFDCAGGSTFVVKKTQFTGTSADTPSAYLAQAYDLNLDTISLRCRIVDAMSKIDQKRARELFTGIDVRSRLQPATPCNEFLVSDVRTYYDTFRDLAKSAFSTKEIEGGYKAQFIENRIHEMVSPVQIGPLAKALNALNLDSDGLERFTTSYCNRLRQLASDYRTASASEALFSVTDSVNELISSMEKRGIPSRVLADAYRDYVVKSVSQRVCGDTYEGAGKVPSLVRRANYFVFRWKPITMDEVKPSGVDAAYEEAPFWTSPVSRKLLEALQRLRFNEKRERYSDAERDTPGWSERFAETLRLLADWKADDERSEEVYVNEKAVTYRTLLELAPTERVRGEILQDFLNFLSSFDAEKVNRVELYWHLKEGLAQTRTTEGKIRPEVITKLSNSTNPVLQLYGSLLSEAL